MILTITRNGISERRTVQEWSAISGVAVTTIQRRKGRGASDEDAVFRPVSNSVKMRELGRVGGTARAVKLTPARRKEIAAGASRVMNGEPETITALGFTGTTHQWAERCGIDAGILYARLVAGWLPLDIVTVAPGAER